MALPEGRGVHVDQLLTQVAINYRPTGFIAEQFFPVVDVQKQSDAYVVWNQGDQFRQWNTQRAPGTRANRMNVQVSSAKYFAENYALRWPVTVEDRANADPIFVRHLEEGRAMQLRDAIEIDAEVRLANLVRTATNIGSTATVGSAWSSYAVADPLGDLWSLMDNFHTANGYWPNRVTFGRVGWNGFSRNNTVISKVNPAGGVSGGGPSATPQQAANLLGVEQVLVGKAAYNSANEAAAMSLTDVWGDDVMVSYVPNAPSREVPSAGYIFRWANPELMNNGMAIMRHPFDSREGAQDIEIRLYQDEAITASALIWAIKGVNSSQ